MNAEEYYNKEGIKKLDERTRSRLEQTIPCVHWYGSLLDIGCGEGYWIKYLSSRTNLELTGIDISEQKINFAKNNCLSAKFISADALKLNIKDNSFDQVTLLETIEHIPEWIDVVQEAIRIAKRRVVITVPYRENIKTIKCPHCCATTSLDGHVFSFEESDFAAYKPKIRLLNPPGILHYIKRAFSTTTSKNVCMNCNKEIDYSPIKTRATDRIRKILNGKPEYMLITIEKTNPKKIQYSNK